ncbi:histone deacetylase [bacterium]|nr:histone deacetylase [bacterium]
MKFYTIGCLILISVFLAQTEVCSAAPKKAKEDAMLPIVYSPQYDISVLGIENLHPFDTKKYGKVFGYLKQTQGLSSSQFYTPLEVTKDLLLTVHTQAYLNSLKKSQIVAEIAEIHALAYLPNGILDNGILKPMRLATGGTMLGCDLAKKHGWAINLSGGYHHAKADAGGGFCYYADIPIAAFQLLKRQPAGRILIVDLDAHQGDGIESICKKETRIHVFDVFNQAAYPLAFELQKTITYPYGLLPETGDQVYLDIIKKELPQAIHKSQPDFIFYNAGVDIYAEDPLGGLSVSENAIIERDAIVFREALKQKIPILMVLSGGYAPAGAGIIGKSIVNLLRNVIFD